MKLEDAKMGSLGKQTPANAVHVSSLEIDITSPDRDSYDGDPTQNPKII